MPINLFGGNEWVDASADEVNTFITDIVAQSKIGSLSKEDVLKAARSIAEQQKDSSLMIEVEQRLG